MAYRTDASELARSAGKPRKNLAASDASGPAQKDKSASRTGLAARHGQALQNLCRFLLDSTNRLEGLVAAALKGQQATG